MPYADFHLGCYSSPPPDNPTTRILYNRISAIPVLRPKSKDTPDPDTWYTIVPADDTNPKFPQQAKLYADLQEAANTPTINNLLHSAASHLDACQAEIHSCSLDLQQSDPGIYKLIPRSASQRHHIDNTYAHLHTAIDQIAEKVGLKRTFTHKQQ